jgi:hypothetical protein
MGVAMVESELVGGECTSNWRAIANGLPCPRPGGSLAIDAGAVSTPQGRRGLAVSGRAWHPNGDGERLWVPDVMLRYRLRTRRAARAVMQQAGAFLVGGQLVVRLADLVSWEESRRASGRSAPRSAIRAPRRIRLTRHTPQDELPPERGPEPVPQEVCHDRPPPGRDSRQAGSSSLSSSRQARALWATVVAEDAPPRK